MPDSSNNLLLCTWYHHTMATAYLERFAFNSFGGSQISASGVASTSELPYNFDGNPKESAIQTAIQRVSSKLQRPTFRYIRLRIEEPN
ncbi:MAG: hypothetical protein KCHDKBKB_01698 [Elusimicrobia bacterium]|nr:hypothetical protein [Elusimicrobiota bacterium]